MLSAQNFLGQTPLHLAADWPWGCNALLKAGADVSIVDFCGHLPLSYACFLDCFETVEILIAANSPLSSGCSEPSVLDRAICLSNNELILAALINELAIRRDKLLKTSQLLLPKQLFEELRSGLKSLPNIEAFFLIKALSDAGDNIDPNYWSFTYSSVYDLQEITTEIAGRLFTVGFKDLEGKDAEGLTILLRIAMRVAWKPELISAKILSLLSKGVSLRTHVETRQLSVWLIPSVNVVSAMLGQEVNRLLVWHQAPGNSTKELLRHVLGSRYHMCYDSCKCSCSLNCCTSLSMFLKGWNFHAYYPIETERKNEHRGPLIDGILQIIAPDLTALEMIGLMNSVLRFCLFEKLGLGHTCCRPTYWSFGERDLLPPIEAKEALEIQEEDEELLAKFQDLLPKAEFEYHGACQSFSAFWFKFCDETIASSLKDEIHENDFDSTIGISVKMDKMDPDEYSWRYDCWDAAREERRRLGMDTGGRVVHGVTLYQTEPTIPKYPTGL